MELLLEDFIMQMNNHGSLHATEFLKQIQDTRKKGLDVWLLDDENKRVAIVVLHEDGTFRAQNILSLL